MARLTVTLLMATLGLGIVPGQALDDPCAGYLETRVRLSPVAVASRNTLSEMLGRATTPALEFTGDVSGKAFASASPAGQPQRTLMMMLDDGTNVALRATDEIDALEVGQRVSVIAVICRTPPDYGDLIVEEWAYEWDLPREPEPVGDPEEDDPAGAAPQPPEHVTPPQVPSRLPQTVAPRAVQVDAVDVWTAWVREHNSKLSEQQARDIVGWVLHYAQQFNVNHKLIFALIKWESWFNPSCVSHSGAIGLMQLMPGTARGLGVNPRNVQQNIQGGTSYLSQQLATYADRPNYDRVILALACYNAGPNAVKRAGHRVPNIAETQRYVKKVSATFKELHDAGMP